MGGMRGGQGYCRVLGTITVGCFLSAVICELMLLVSGSQTSFSQNSILSGKMFSLVSGFGPMDKKEPPVDEYSGHEFI